MRKSSAVAYHPSVPRHLQIQRVLRERIESGEWDGGRPIPTEMELLAEFGVSRTTVREALGVLSRDGLIARHRGRGSFVQRRSQAERPQAVTNLLFGYQAQVKVITSETAPAPAHIVTPIRPRYLTQISLLEFLRDRLGMRLGAIHQSIEARLPDVETAGLLGTDLTQPVLAIRLVVTDVAARPVEVSDAFYRADRYRYEVETRLPPATRRPNARTVRLRRGVRTVLQP